MPILVISRSDVERTLTPEIALSLVEGAMRAASRGDAKQLVRRILELPGCRGFVGDMPGALGPDLTFGLKCISVFPTSAAQRAPHRGFLVLFGPTGIPVAVIEAGAVTAYRTAAASALATRCLARRSARILGICGAGEQAEHHIPALLTAWSFDEVLIWARRPAAARLLVSATVEHFDVRPRILASSREIADADVICTLTSAEEPFLLGEWIRPGCHINLVGSSSLGPCEVDSSLVAMARYFVDSIETASTHASELQRAKMDGLVDTNHIRGEIGAVLDGHVPGRQGDSDITIYKSLGHIAQDLAVGWYLYERALTDGFGTSASF